MTTTDRQFCSLCNLSIHLSDWVIGDDGNPAHARPARCIALLREEIAAKDSLIDSLALDLGLESRALAEARAQFSAFLERVGAYVKTDGTTGLTSAGFADWRRRKGNALLEDEIDRLKRGDFTPDEFQNLCHNLPDTCTREVFESGCKDYQAKLFGSPSLEMPCGGEFGGGGRQVSDEQALISRRRCNFCGDTEPHAALAFAAFSTATICFRCAASIICQIAEQSTVRTFASNKQRDAIVAQLDDSLRQEVKI